MEELKTNKKHHIAGTRRERESEGAFKNGEGVLERETSCGDTIALREMEGKNRRFWNIVSRAGLILESSSGLVLRCSF